MSKYSCLQEKFFIQPDKGLTVVNSDNASSAVLIDPNDEEKVYSNQMLAGNAHPRTKIPPIVPIRPLDTGGPNENRYWRDGPMSSLSIINSRKPQYPSLAGYGTQELVDLECLNPRSRTSLSHVQASPLVQTLQPGVYDFPTDYQPVIGPEGISETPQFEPIRTYHQNGNVVFSGIAAEPVAKRASAAAASGPTAPPSSGPASTSEADKNLLKVRTEIKEKYEPNTLNDQDVSLYNVYDPRFSGYGSDNRAYLEPTLRQTRYYYDDVDAIRMPNYIVRSKIDSCITGFGDQYGPMQNVQLSLNQTRPLAEQAYLDNNLNYRNDLMQTLMSKRNAEMWQTRQAPKYTQRQGLK